jgi:hypothetical protein
MADHSKASAMSGVGLADPLGTLLDTRGMLEQPGHEATMTRGPGLGDCASDRVNEEASFCWAKARTAPAAVRGGAEGASWVLQMRGELAGHPARAAAVVDQVECAMVCAMNSRLIEGTNSAEVVRFRSPADSSRLLWRVAWLS